MMDKDQYQDIRVHGKTISYGRRECESRYEAILPFLMRYKNRESFTVLDFGANYGYFSWRIKEDFPNAKITMVDGRPLLELLFAINETEGMELFSEGMQLERIREFSKDHHFDLILLMSVLHHFESPEEIFDAFQAMGETILLETDYPNQPCFTGLEGRIHDYIITKNPIQINKWIEHDRPLYYFNDEIAVRGIVESGSGVARENIPHFNWIFDWFGKKFFPGTLNLWLSKGIDFKHILKINSYSFMQMYLNGFPLLSIKDTKSNPPKTFLELISSDNLREKFNLKDGDEVIVSFKNENVWVIE